MKVNNCRRMDTRAGQRHSGRKLTPLCAESLRLLLGLTRKDIVADMSSLAEGGCSRSDIHKWFSLPKEGTQGAMRGPSASLTIYLRLALRVAWQRRCRARTLAARPKGDLMARAIAFIEAASPKQLERFDLRLRQSEDELAAGQPRSHFQPCG